jgi:tRNA(Ile)-lysidine synthase
MSSNPSRLDPLRPVGDRFLTGLAAGLPSSFPGGFPVVVGVSGGADSVGLLLGLHRLLAVPIVVAHAEHDLRSEARDDRLFVERLAAELGLPFEWRTLAVRGGREAKRGEGLEARARRLRYAFLSDVAHARGGRHVLVAHTADDQAETILHRILRGTGLAGLAGMRRSRELCDGVALVRPLLDVSRADVRQFVERLAAEWREDATNADVTRARNFLRHEVLPRCQTGPYPAATRSLVRLGHHAAAVSGAVGAAATWILRVSSTTLADGRILVRTRDLAGLEAPMAAEIFVALWQREAWPRRDMTAGHYRSLAALMEAPPAAGPIDFPGGVRASRTAEGIMFERLA